MKKSGKMFDTLVVYINFCKDTFLMQYTSGGKKAIIKKPFQILLSRHLCNDIFSISKSVTMSGTNKHLDLGWYDIDLENSPHLVNRTVSLSLERYNICHLALAPFLGLMKDDPPLLWPEGRKEMTNTDPHHKNNDNDFLIHCL